MRLYAAAHGKCLGGGEQKLSDVKEFLILQGQLSATYRSSVVEDISHRTVYLLYINVVWALFVRIIWALAKEKKKKS